MGPQIKAEWEVRNAGGQRSRSSETCCEQERWGGPAPRSEFGIPAGCRLSEPPYLLSHGTK